MAEGLTLVVATPYMDEADRCHRVALIHQGRILRSASPDALRETLKKTVLELRADPLPLAKDLLARASLPLRSYLMGDRLHLLTSEGEEALPRVDRILEGGGVRVEGLRRSSPIMEDVFETVQWTLQG